MKITFNWEAIRAQVRYEKGPNCRCYDEEFKEYVNTMSIIEFMKFLERVDDVVKVVKP